MGASQPRKGKVYERELVREAKAHQLPAERAWGSDGRSFNEHPTVDLLVDDQKIQAKRKKNLPAYLRVPKHCDALVMRADNNQSLVVLRWPDYLAMLRVIQFTREHLDG